MAIGLPVWVIKAIDNKRRAFLWTALRAPLLGWPKGPSLADRLRHVRGIHFLCAGKWFFLWFAFQRRCWTADLIQKRGIDSHLGCPFCVQDLDTANHILFDCMFARWFQDWWSSFRACLPEHLYDSFDSLVFLVSWRLWKERNSRVFDSALSSISVVLEFIHSEGHMWSLAGVVAFGDLLGV
uniref:OSJNBa0076N16.2 protein n=1 Tax=Oryza sativa subsp. japonica TaxID=39947 RepID=Q7X7T7_ORYSJ|nr:OSJNBa0084K20.4 [Oryza sativa Japonica Group]CAE02481.2 OSJNBa0076N16.2 [Oryza sativa Japonica Group]